MGGGDWSHSAYNSYCSTTKGMSAVNYAAADWLTTQDVYTARCLQRELNPKDVIRECLDSEEHPNTLPVILALDVTGSMGSAAQEVSQKLGKIMEDIYSSNEVKDVEFCIMAIGDLYCDSAPIQISQFESDVRIAEHLDKIFFEGGGGGNTYESYTAAWYMGLRHCKLDCWKRGEKGIIITLGDEKINPYLQKGGLRNFVGDNAQADIETADLYREAIEKFEIHHISVDDSHSSYRRYQEMGIKIDESWKEILGEGYHVCSIADLPKMISGIITGHKEFVSEPVITEQNEISW